MQTYLTCPYPTYRLCLSLSLPTPLICKTQFSPKLTLFFLLLFFLFLPFYSPTMISSPNPLYRPCSANLPVTYSTPNPYVPFPEGNEGGLASCAEAQLKPPDGLLVAQRPTTPGGFSGPQRERRDGWCGGVHFLTTLTI